MRYDKRIFLILWVLAAMLWFFSTTVSAVTIQATPSTATTGQLIQMTITSTYSSTPDCTLQVNFGDNSSWQRLSVCSGGTPCLRTTNHIYRVSGRYRVRTVPAPDPSGSNCTNLVAPRTTATWVTITAPEISPPVVVPPQEITLPDGVVGMTYTYTMGSGVSTYRKIKGKIDTGLRIVQNKIKGKPYRPGKYHFKVQAIDPHGMLKATGIPFGLSRPVSKYRLTRKRYGWTGIELESYN